MTQPSQLWQREELGYCSNVHPCDSYEALIDIIGTYLGPVRTARGLERMASGLWINANIATQLVEDHSKLKQLKSVLAQNGIDVITLNGFPYGDFHDEVVKETVYEPDWRDERRLNYSIQLAQILATLIPSSTTEGTISTVPLGFRQHWAIQDHKRATQNLLQLVLSLHELEQQYGVRIRFCIEMEPSCVLEDSEEIINYFQQHLYAQKDVPVETVSRHLGVCYDVCHQAVMHEDQKNVLQSLIENNIAIGKIQISSALVAKTPAEPKTSQALETYAEKKYLHQVRSRDNGGKLLGTLDLMDALHDQQMLSQQEWRIHFHTPVHTDKVNIDNLATTQLDIIDVLDFLAGNKQTHPHLEVETYTWHVLPEEIRPTDKDSLVENLTKELTWLEEVMTLKGLLENTV